MFVRQQGLGLVSEWRAIEARLQISQDAPRFVIRRWPPMQAHVRHVVLPLYVRCRSKLDISSVLEHMSAYSQKGRLSQRDEQIGVQREGSGCVLEQVFWIKSEPTVSGVTVFRTSAEPSGVGWGTRVSPGWSRVLREPRVAWIRCVYPSCSPTNSIPAWGSRRSISDENWALLYIPYRYTSYYSLDSLEEPQVVLEVCKVWYKSRRTTNQGSFPNGNHFLGKRVVHVWL